MCRFPSIPELPLEPGKSISAQHSESLPSLMRQNVMPRNSTWRPVGLNAAPRAAVAADARRSGRRPRRARPPGIRPPPTVRRRSRAWPPPARAPSSALSRLPAVWSKKSDASCARIAHGIEPGWSRPVMMREHQRLVGLRGWHGTSEGGFSKRERVVKRKDAPHTQIAWGNASDVGQKRQGFRLPFVLTPRRKAAGASWIDGHPRAVISSDAWLCAPAATRVRREPVAGTRHERHPRELRRQADRIRPAGSPHGRRLVLLMQAGPLKPNRLAAPTPYFAGTNDGPHDEVPLLMTSAEALSPAHARPPHRLPSSSRSARP